jgi:uncharacterized protein
MTRMRRRTCLAAVTALPVGACVATRPTSFYTLSAMPERRTIPPRGRGLKLGLGPVTLPPYLDRPDIVTREGPNQLRLAEFDRWAEPLEPLLARIMAADLHALLDAEDVIPVPLRRDVRLDRVVAIDVGRLDADPKGEVVFDARWWVYDGEEEELLTSGRSLITEQGAPPPDYDAIVAAMSRAVAAAAKDIATAVRGGAPVPAPKRPTGPGHATTPRVAPRPGS